MIAYLLLAQLQIAGFSTPPSGDTTGYWQQRVHYELVARLEEERGTLVGHGRMWYVNNSPDTLSELYFHQHLNAFRPGSRWSAVDERENRQRFQRLADPDFGFERFTALPRVDGAEVMAGYPFAPDSTVVRIQLPAPLLPADSVQVELAWEARPSTVPRRQGRRGRQYDFAHWYPRIAVYDRGGWQHNPLVPAGEFYGEFGSYDVTLVLREDQVVGATGVPVEGDPGWERARVWGSVHPRTDSYGAAPPAAVRTDVPDGHRSVRFMARDVHHFGWAAAPDFRYEGGLYDGRIAVHILYRPGSAGAWGEGQAAQRVAYALAFLEHVFGTYVYPQVTNLNRLDGGGTEFPMLMMNFSASQGLILHELAHIYIHGILANNEWRDAWLDEGLASYLTLWGQGFSQPERSELLAERPPRRPAGYSRHAIRPDQFDAGDMAQFRYDLLGRAEPMATLAHEFSEFGIYTAMSYGRAELMWGALRDLMGDERFIGFLREFYARWQLRHVDELAVRTVASDVYGASLDWFFDQWLHRTGLIDYALRTVRVVRDGDGWLTRARVVRRGEYRHPMPLGVRTDTVWTLARASVQQDDQWLEIRTSARPDEIRLDPWRMVPDWDRRNDVARRWGGGRDHMIFDWPFLSHASRERNAVAVTPFGWFTDPGGVTLGVRSRQSYQGWIDQSEFGFTLAVRNPEGPEREEGRRWVHWLNSWVALENPRLPFIRRPLVGWRLDAWNVDALSMLALRRRFDLSRFHRADGMRRSLDISFTTTGVTDTVWVDRARWADRIVADLSAEMRWDPVGVDAVAARVLLLGGASARGVGRTDVERDGPTGGFWRVEGEARRRFVLDHAERSAARLRVFGGLSGDAPRQRALGLSALDPTQSFRQHLYRGAGAPFARDGVHYVPTGGAGLRAFSPLLRAEHVVAANLEVERAVFVPRGASPLPGLWFSLFGDIGAARAPWTDDATLTLGDAGAGLALRGRLFDRPVSVRLDVPLYVSHPALAVGGRAAHERVRARWVIGAGEF
jgi:hypothetical protein